ncbi:MAG: linear amide C-N hydrolase [Sphingomonadaceae bacterium]|uniref:linear amide C-N hydrolase n=1 Tax=Thermaurantiacus sp. TaxID=2820283 RepID=UPI00298F06A3|nr:linear amide C-N hydrolase [Thermaurantiacus sp.]MCS6986295.1 linear amide C-N hydrolase [Sphingomonadaceae bacterium]MDW8415744.1 linear amide C-N hydrolase [Thermaurantiacus sp.]
MAISVTRGAVVAATLLAASPGMPCTRAVYEGPNGRFLTGRSMDWKEDIRTNLWALPRGMARDGAAGPGSLRWTSQYGSVVATGYDIATADGLNEAGLMVNGLWMTQSAYPRPDGRTPTMALSVFGQYLLDQFATVAEAVAWLRANPLLVLTGEVPGQGRMATMHFALSDATGDSAVIEWIRGDMRIHHDRGYRVMTNEPPFEEQLAITSYWRKVGGIQFLPGTNRAADRFARASFYVDAVTKSDDPRVAAAATFSVIRNASVPLGITTPDRPNISSTRWRVVADHKDRLYYFESTVSPNVFWVDLKRLDFAPRAGVRRLDLGRDQSNLFAGEVSARFRPAPMFRFQPT